MILKDIIKEHSHFKTSENILFGPKISIENKEIHTIYLTKIILFASTISNTTVEPLGLMFKEKIDGNYEYYIQFLNEFQKEYTDDIVKEYYKEFKEEIKF